MKQKLYKIEPKPPLRLGGLNQNQIHRNPGLKSGREAAAVRVKVVQPMYEDLEVSRDEFDYNLAVEIKLYNLIIPPLDLYLAWWPTFQICGAWSVWKALPLMPVFPS